ncbi:Agamous-like MADS-box protein AGL29 [Linum perenne]
MAETENNVIPAKKTKGRQKIPLQKIEDPVGRAITFSKRRRGIYKKASELVTLCGAEVGVMFFSPAGKPFTYGYPSIDSIVERFIRHPLPQPPIDRQSLAIQRFIGVRSRVMIEELNQQHNEVAAEVEALKEKAAELRSATAARKMEKKELDWKSINKMRLDELRELKERLVTLEGKLDEQAKEMDASSSLLLLSGTQSMEMDAPSTLLLLSRTQAVEEATNLDDSNIS